MPTSDVDEEGSFSRKRLGQLDVTGLPVKEFETCSPVTRLESGHDFLQCCELFRLLGKILEARELGIEPFLEGSRGVVGNILVIGFCEERWERLDGWAAGIESVNKRIRRFFNFLLALLRLTRESKAVRSSRLRDIHVVNDSIGRLFGKGMGDFVGPELIRTNIYHATNRG